MILEPFFSQFPFTRYHKKTFKYLFSNYKIYFFSPLKVIYQNVYFPPYFTYAFTSLKNIIFILPPPLYLLQVKKSTLFMIKWNKL